MKTIEQLGADLVLFLHHLLSPETLGMVVTLGGLGWKLIDSIKKNFKADQTKMGTELGLRLDAMEKANKEAFETLELHHSDAYRDMQKEILRLQILEGIDAKRLSSSEARYFYDKYKTFGGNSFVTEKVHRYLEEIEGDDDDVHSS